MDIGVVSTLPIMNNAAVNIGAQFLCAHMFS